MDDQEVAEILTKTTSAEPTNAATVQVEGDFGNTTLKALAEFMGARPDFVGFPRCRFVGLDRAADNVVVASAEENSRAYRERLACSLAPSMVSSIKPPEYPVIDHILPRGRNRDMVIYDTEAGFDRPNANGRIYPRGAWLKTPDSVFPVELLPDFKCLPKTVPPWLYERDHVHALEHGTAQEFSDNVLAVMEDTAYQRTKRIADVLEGYNIRVRDSKCTCNYLTGELVVWATTARSETQLNNLMRNKKVRESMWGSVTVVVETEESKNLNGTIHYAYHGTTFISGLADYNAGKGTMRWIKNRARTSGFSIFGTQTGRLNYALRNYHTV